MPYRFLPHTGDVAVALDAPDDLGLRTAGIEALRELLVGTSPVGALVERPIAPKGRDDAERLVRFLEDALYLYDVEGFVPARASPTGILGEPFDPARHAPAGEVKAVTYHQAAVRRDDTGLHATIVFDV